jgi:hypothetical protein
MNIDDSKEMNRLLATGMHPLIVLDVLVERWNGRWIMGGEEVRCRKCEAAQWPSNSHDPMLHLPGCPQVHQYPWRDLAAIMRVLPCAAD